MLNIKRFEDKYREEALRLLERSDSTNRSPETWLGNNMTAVLAFDDAKLVGIIPFEQRDIVAKGGKMVKALWVSDAHVIFAV